MKRLHVHVSVENLQDSIHFYSTLFGTVPTVAKQDYAKWMLEDPRVNFAISHRGNKNGLDHLGIQVENAHELTEVTARLNAADASIEEQAATTCCYAQSSKTWSTDPQGISWETFYTFGASTIYGESTEVKVDAQLSTRLEDAGAGACCVRSPL